MPKHPPESYRCSNIIVLHALYVPTTYVSNIQDTVTNFNMYRLVTESHQRIKSSAFRSILSNLSVIELRRTNAKWNVNANAKNLIIKSLPFRTSNNRCVAKLHYTPTLRCAIKIKTIHLICLFFRPLPKYAVRCTRHRTQNIQCFRLIYLQLEYVLRFIY